MKLPDLLLKALRYFWFRAPRLCCALLASAGGLVFVLLVASLSPRQPFVLEHFPVQGEFKILDGFGSPRPNGRTHEGVDIGAAKMTPVVAVADGVVAWMHGKRRCCDLGLRHDNGWETSYIHLNNDTPGTDDGRGYGIAPGLVRGTAVEAGQLIGWVGDSGNAEATVSHLHFELRRPSGAAEDPLPLLTGSAGSD